MLPRIWLTIGLLLICTQAVYGQDASNWFIRSGVTSAYVLPSNPFEPAASGQSDPISWVPDLTIEIGRQTDGSEGWHRLYGMPSYGFGFSIARFQNSVSHGIPLEAYTFFTWPFVGFTDRLDLATEFGMGLSWNWQQVNQQTAASDTVLSSNLNARIDWGFYLRYISTPRLILYTGVDFTHRSNGGLVQPNKGINVLGPKVALQYGLGPAPPRHPTVNRPAFRPSWELVIGGAAGIKDVAEQTSPVMRQDFGVFHTTAALQHQFYQYGKIAYGADLTYDGGTGAKSTIVNGVIERSRAAAEDRWAGGVYGGYEHLIGRFSVFAHVGVTVARGFSAESAPSRVYERLGWRYRLSDHFWAMVAIRAIDGNEADFLEAGAGYRIPLGSR